MNLYPDKTMRISIASLGAVSALASLWQFYLFVQFRNSAGVLDPQGGTVSLWLAMAAAAVAAAAMALLVLFAAHDDKEDVIHIAYDEEAPK